MWKSFFYFSGPQRAGILVLICLILLVGVFDCCLPLFVASEPLESDSLFLKEIDDFKKSLSSIDSAKDAPHFRFSSSNYNSSKDAFRDSYAKNVTLFPFDPNVLDSSGFVALGLKPFIAGNILKYRRKGGVFKDKESFARIYGLSEDKFKELSDYIMIQEHVKPQMDTVVTNPNHVADLKKLLVELNAADTTVLMQIKGIGRAYARSIVGYRRQTGGFVSIEQLSEIYGMTPENLERIKPYCTIDRTLIQKIKVNTASVDRLKAHPYLNFYQAKQIYELRRKKGTLTGMADLNQLSELNDTTLAKIAEYLSFD